jgi:hypothetical protein
VSTFVLVMLACVLPLVVLVSSQLRFPCVDDAACRPAEQVGAWLLVPSIVAWFVVVLTLVIRAGRRRWKRARRESTPRAV